MFLKTPAPKKEARTVAWFPETIFLASIFILLLKLLDIYQRYINYTAQKTKLD